MNKRSWISPRISVNAVFLFITLIAATLFSTVTAFSAQVTLAWDPNTETNLRGYKLYYGFESSNYTHTIDVGNQTSYSISDLESNVVHYFAATAYDTSGNESDFSEEVSYLVPKEPVPTENGPPVADAGPDQTLPEGVTVTLDGTNSTDPDGDAVSYLWEQTDGQTVVLLDTADGSVTFTAPDVGPDGASLSFKLTVSDSTGLQSEDDCIVNVSWVNIPPTANASFDQTVDKGVTVTLSGSLSSDPDDGIASFLWEQTGGPTVSLSDPSAAQPDFVAPDVSSQDVALTFQLTVEDFGGLRSTDMCVVNVSFINMPPVADAGPDQTLLEGVTVTLDGTNSTDPDGDAVSYLWEQTDGPTVVLLDTADGSVTFTAPDVGPDGASLSFKLTVSDSTGLQSEDDCIVNVSWVNIPPTANASFDQTVDEGVTVTLSGSLSSDPDDGIVSFLWEQTGGPTVSLSNPSAAQPDFVAPDVSSQDVALTFQLTVEDFGGLRSTDMCVVNVSFINTPPVADAGPDQNANAGETVILDGSNSSDPDDGIATFRWKQLSGTPVVFSDPTAMETSFTVPDEITGDDSLIFQLTVVDVGGLTSQDTCTIAMIAKVVNFNVNPVQSYGGGHDKSAAVTIDDGGSTLRIVGNGWKKIEFPYTITEDTILEFDFQSTAEGEIHGIGFDIDDSIANPIMVFKLHGTQKWGIVDFDNYAGETPKHYIIPVGRYYTGDVLYLTFANDHDIKRPTAESVFKNVKVYELD